MAKRGRGGSRERSNDSRGIMAFIIMALACSFVVVWALQCCIHYVRVCVCVTTHIQTNNVIRIAARRSALPLLLL